jgi:Lon protease-like protein
MSMLESIPLFPLRTVLFPGQLLPLHIFEMRYRQMINDCIEHETPFGVVLIRKGREVGETAEPYSVGTLARIRRVEREEDGRMHIYCIGEERFRIESLVQEQPYLVARIERLQWQANPAGNYSARMASLRVNLTQYLQSLAAAVGTPIQVEELPDDPYLLGCVAAIALRLPNKEKQELLASLSLEQLIDLSDSLLRRENRAFQIGVALPEQRDEDAPNISLN